jgi:hypothetical protein
MASYASSSGHSDDDNTSFGIPERRLERNSGFVREVAAEEGKTGEHRRRPSKEADIPQESLATRIAQGRKERERS